MDWVFVPLASPGFERVRPISGMNSLNLDKHLAADYYRANQEAITALLCHPTEEREASKLLGFEQTYHYTAPHKSRVTDFLRAPTPEPDPNLPPIRLVPLTAEQEMAKIRAIKSMITGEEGESQEPEVTGGTSFTPTGQQEGTVLALVSKQPAGRSKKRLRKEQTGPRLADEDSTDHVSTELGDQTEQPQTDKSKGPATPPVWAPEFKYQGRAVSAEDSVYADKDYSLGFNLTKELILPADMKKHDELSDLKVLRSAAKSIVLAAQKNYLAHNRMIKVRQSLRDAIAENKAQKAEISKIKAAQEAVEAERDNLSQKVNRAKADKQRAVKSTKARYLAELRTLRDAHKEEKDKAVQETKDIFFQCDWKAAVEKVGLGQDTDMFLHPPAAFIPYYMQAYASAAQKRLIKEAKKEAAEEAAAATQQTEQTSPEASQDAEDQVADREVVAVEDADDELEEGLPEHSPEVAGQTLEVTEQTVDLELD
ncbi:uncharacterized protein LOC114307223 [Camellia sinensis]|uniref:uncharacterized protein LOC114307223 n=1 Tax=Camellia sinensis TaxID=4442 RepID=UPI001035FEF1|nr:uncharacterized protein LOC114307223 [Camellia sinensis]